MRIRAIFAAVVLLATAFLQGQAPLVPGTPDTALRYEVVRTDTAATSEAVTIQQIASPQATVQLEVGYVYCSVACTATLSWNGTAATSTSLSTIALNGAPASTATAWRSSNVGSGITGNVYNIAAAGTLTLDLTKFILGRGNGTGQNFTISVASASGNYQVMIQWIER